MKNKSIMIGKFILLIILTLTFAGGLLLTFNNQQQPLFRFTNEPDENQALKSFVYLSGEVANPGVYEINDETRLLEVIEMAGGFTEDADRNYINSQLNLSKILKDEEKILIPSATLPTSSVNGTTNLVNINNATSEELQGLPGIGEATAKKIIDARPFLSIEQLLDISGIGESKFEKIKELVTI